MAVRSTAPTPPFIELGTEDQVFKLGTSDPGLCREMEQKLPWLL